MFARRTKLILKLRRNGRPRSQRAVGHDRILLSDRHGRTEKSRGPARCQSAPGPARAESDWDQVPPLGNSPKLLFKPACPAVKTMLEKKSLSTVPPCVPILSIP